MSDKTLTFTAKQLAEALNDFRCMYDLGPELIAEEVFAALAQHPAPAVPTGWKLVPVEPTGEMIAAAFNVFPCSQTDMFRAMLAAAPAAPVAQGQWPFGCPCNSAPATCENCSPAAEQPEKLLDRPAKVGAVRFNVGVPERLVIDAAQRQHEYEINPPFTDEQISGLAKVVKPSEQPDTVAVPRELLEELADIADAMQCYDARDDAIALLAGGAA